MASRGDGAAVVDLYGNRWCDFAEAVTINNDLTGATFAAQVRLTPDTTGSPLATMTISTPSIVGSVTSFNMTISEATMEAMPAATETGDDAVFYWDLVMTLAGAKRVLFAGKFTVIAGVTQ